MVALALALALSEFFFLSQSLFPVLAQLTSTMALSALLSHA